jgi:hypothetical protein
VQSTPEGGLRDRQVVHGEAASRARRPSRSIAQGSHRVRRGHGALLAAPVPPPHPLPQGVFRERPVRGRLGCGGHYARGFPPSAVKPPALARSPGLEQGRVGRSAGVPARSGEGRPARASRLGEGRITPRRGRPPSPPLISGGVGPVLKHGPRSAGRMQGERILIPMYRNERNH